MDFAAPRAPIRVEDAYDDPGAVRALLASNAPYWTVQNYVASQAEGAAVQRSQEAMTVIPWFRGDWAYGATRIDGVSCVLENPRFIDAARKLFDAEVVHPLVVYVNLMAPLPFAGEPHIDVPAFRGIDRTEHPVWLLHVMGRSGLFERHRVAIATAVSWFYDGANGDFEYWPDGPAKPSRRERSPFGNVAVVGDNDVMFHRVDRIGAADEALAPGLTLKSLLTPSAVGADGVEAWEIREGERALATYPAHAVRVSVSWKAEVFRDEQARRIRLDHRDDLHLDEVVGRLLRDLRERGTRLEEPSDPLTDSRFIAALSSAHPLPAVSAAAAR